MLNISTTQSPLQSVESQDLGRVYLTNRNGQQSYILVQKQQNEWAPVSQLEGPIDRYSFQSDYAFAPVKMAPNGAPSWTPGNGNSGSIVTSGLQYRAEQSAFVAGEEVTQTSRGEFVIQSKQVHIPSHRKPNHSECAEVMEVHYDDSEWAVAVS